MIGAVSSIRSKPRLIFLPRPSEGLFHDPDWVFRIVFTEFNYKWLWISIASVVLVVIVVGSINRSIFIVPACSKSPDIENIWTDPFVLNPGTNPKIRFKIVGRCGSEPVNALIRSEKGSVSPGNWTTYKSIDESTATLLLDRVETNISQNWILVQARHGTAGNQNKQLMWVEMENKPAGVP